MTKFNLKNTKKYIALALLVFMIPTFTSAAKSTGSGYGYDGGWGDSGYGDYSSSYYAPSYTSTTGYSPYSYSTPSYGGGYSSPSYGGSSISGGSYRPSYGSTSYGSSYRPPSYTGSSIPSTSYSSSNPYTTSSAKSNANSTSNAKASNETNVVATGGESYNVNNNVNNVYVYTNPTGNAVVHNPEYQRLDGYCVITPSNARVGQTVTATAYITGGIGNYTYTWGGDLMTSASGVSTSFTSYNPGTKNITVTVRSDQDVITKTCTVTFENQVAYNSYGSYSSSVTTGTPVSGVYLQPSYVSTGSPVSGVYLNDLPATGIDLNWMHYMVGLMVLVLASVATVVSRAKKSFATNQ